MEISQFQIVLVNLDPTIGHEIKKTRPCVVVSPNELNKYLKTVVVLPMTTSLNNYPTRVKINFEGKPGMIAVDQIRTIDKNRIVKRLGNITKVKKKKIKSVIHETFVL